jgi:antitoxin component YwqK of YwqJK toxin-antitoxin module
MAEPTNQTIDGEKHGLWITYFANGNKRAEGQYQHGKKQGPWTQWHKNGRVASKATFHEGDYTGRYQTFHDNGNLQREGMDNPIRGNSADGTKGGEWPSYQLDGKTVWRIITYKRGARACEDQIFAERDH